MSNYEAEIDQLPMPRPSKHRICSLHGKEYFDNDLCPDCVLADKAADQGPASSYDAYSEFGFAAISSEGSGTFERPWGRVIWGPDAIAPAGIYRILYAHRRGALPWYLIYLASGSRVWIKGSRKFGVTWKPTRHSAVQILSK